jgi:DNA polymerase III sliding clamp (beta) subunit (PCNA family)
MSHVVVKNAYVPMLSNLLIRSGDGVVNFYATSLDTSVSCGVPVGKCGKINVCVDAKLFYNIIKSGMDKFDISINGKNVVVKSGTARYRISCVGGSAYPKIHSPQGDSKFFSINGKDFSKFIDKVAFCSSVGKTSGDGITVFFDDNDITFAATDGCKIGAYVVKNESGYKGRFFINKNTCSRLLKIAGGQKDISMYIETVTDTNKKLFVKFDNTEVCCVLGDDKKIIPFDRIFNSVNKDKPIMVNRDDMIAALKRLMVVCDSKNDGRSGWCNIKICDDVIKLSSSNDSLGSVSEEVKATCVDSGEFIVDISNLSTFLSKMESEYIILCYDGRYFYIKDNDVDYQGVIMPINPTLVETK